MLRLLLATTKVIKSEDMGRQDLGRIHAREMAIGIQYLVGLLMLAIILVPCTQAVEEAGTMGESVEEVEVGARA